MVVQSLPRVSATIAAERERYAQIVASMSHADPSALIHEFRGRTERFSPAELMQKWEGALASGVSRDAAFNLYIHVPYCKSICTFCNYKRLRVSSKDALNDYVDFMVSEMHGFAPSFRGVKFGAVYVGGGTPSVLDATQLDRLLSALHENFAFHKAAQKNFEYDPMVMTEDRLGLLQQFGFSRYSFGIQSLSREINQLHNRGPQDRRHVLRQFDLLRRKGAQQINVDFLLGLDGTTPEEMVQDIREVLSTGRPTEVSVYFISPTPEYVNRHFAGDFARFEAWMQPFEQRVPPLLQQIAQEMGYQVKGDGKHFLVLGPAGSADQVAPDHHYCDIPSQIHRPLYLLGFGDSARSRIFGQLLYRAEHDVDDQAMGSPRYVGAPIDLADEMFGYVSHVFRDGEVLDRTRFLRTFGVDVVNAYAEALEKLSALGVIDIQPTQVLFTTPQPRRERLRDLMFFMPHSRLDDLAPHGTTNPGQGSSESGKRIPAEEVQRLIRPFMLLGAVPGGWRVAEISLGGVALVRKNPNSRVHVRLLAPAGLHPAFCRTGHFDIQYEVIDGSPPAGELEAALVSLSNAVSQNEAEAS